MPDKYAFATDRRMNKPTSRRPHGPYWTTISVYKNFTGRDTFRTSGDFSPTDMLVGAKKTKSVPPDTILGLRMYHKCLFGPHPVGGTHNTPQPLAGFGGRFVAGSGQLHSPRRQRSRKGRRGWRSAPRGLTPVHYRVKPSHFGGSLTIYSAGLYRFVK